MKRHSKCVAGPHDKRVVVVLGMHRSGTSALAGVLASLGVDFGPEEALIVGQTEVNARGYWEHREIVMLNEQLLTASGVSWDDIREVDTGLFESENILKIKDKIKTILVRDFSNSLLWGLKDPRICKLLPLWIDVFQDMGVEPLFIVVYRHPEEVARSLEKRDGFSIEKAYALWLSYIFSAEEFSTGFPRTFVGYDRLLDDWLITMEKAFIDLGLPFDKNHVNSVAVDSFLSPTLRHMISPKDSLKDRRDEWVQKLYDGLLRYSEGNADDPIIRTEFDQLRKNAQAAMSLFVPMIFDKNSANSEVGILRRELSSAIIDCERISEACEQTNAAYEQSNRSYAQTKAAYEQTRVSYERTKAAYEQTKAAYERLKNPKQFLAYWLARIFRPAVATTVESGDKTTAETHQQARSKKDGV